MQKITADIEMMDGTEHKDVRIILADMIRYEEVAKRHKWGGLQDNPITAQSFMAYAAMTRTGVYDPNKGFDEFVTECAGVMADFGDELPPTM
ncbi:hypothetical protein [Corynebacterium heidelbergense]|uniref:Uncharacterized protein n=1 Tax=Corynebacterium heidelbergense TaxID=2055947 RepID=A0A364VA41_9CORY|nr:hypothetical protein [Corynebacterium heidelbergense]RAV33530.1 hypothetical protein CWC39_07950 [Corynebacterium heidelbergense]WCZ36167.1 hypothetical protein CHEID_03035 [Corynebacterium heidelbergense]WCZ37622.1 hypothetical protein CHEID_10525 [Corynebacterium heidelbergense]